MVASKSASVSKSTVRTGSGKSAMKIFARLLEWKSPFPSWKWTTGASMADSSMSTEIHENQMWKGVWLAGIDGCDDDE